MKRVIMHWTAGADGIISLERDHYHILISRDGSTFDGTHPISANVPPLVSGQYAAHTLNCNSYSIGVALDAMAGAVQSPFNPGRYPITSVQVEAMIDVVANLCNGYAIPIARETVLTHAEVQPTLGIAQKWKWDITWLPGMNKPGDPVEVGDSLRSRIAARLGLVYPAGSHGDGDPIPVAPRPILRRGHVGPYVEELQRDLARHGYDIAIDQIFGGETYSVVRWFQARHNLDIDGVVGKNTWSKLKGD